MIESVDSSILGARKESTDIPKPSYIKADINFKHLHMISGVKVISKNIRRNAKNAPKSATKQNKNINSKTLNVIS